MCDKKNCFVCGFNKGEISSFTDKVLEECKKIISFRKEKKYMYGDLSLLDDSIAKLAYHVSVFTCTLGALT